MLRATGLRSKAAPSRVRIDAPPGCICGFADFPRQLPKVASRNSRGLISELSHPSGRSAAVRVIARRMILQVPPHSAASKRPRALRFLQGNLPWSVRRDRQPRPRNPGPECHVASQAGCLKRHHYPGAIDPGIAVNHGAAVSLGQPV